MAEINTSITAIMPNDALPSNGANWPNRQKLIIVSEPIEGYPNRSRITWSLAADYGTAGHSYSGVTCTVKFTISGGAAKISGDTEIAEAGKTITAPDGDIMSGSFLVAHAPNGQGTISAETSFTGINGYFGDPYVYSESGSWNLPLRTQSGGAYICDGSNWLEADAYIYLGNEWKPVDPYIYLNGWKETT